MVRIALGVIAKAQFERVHLERVGQFVHGCLQRERAWGFAGRAHGAGIDGIDRHHAVTRGQVRRGVGDGGNGIACFHMQVVDGGLIEALVHDREQLAVDIGAKRQQLARGGTPAETGEGLLARE